MKRIFFGILGLIIFLVIALMGLATYLNLEGEKAIALRMQAQKARLSGEIVGYREIYPLLRWKTVNLYSNQRADVITQVDGIIEDMAVAPHDSVVEGQTILYLRNQDIPLRIMRVQGSIEKAEAEKNRAQRTYERYKELSEMNATSKQRLDEAEADYLEASATIRELKAQQESNYLMQSYQTVRAPIAGKVLMLYCPAGTYVQSGTPVCLIADFSTLWLRTELPDHSVRCLLPLETGHNVTFRRGEFSKAYGTEYGVGNEGIQQNFKGIIREITPPLDEAANMRSILMEIDNSSGVLEPQRYRMMQMRSGAPIYVLAVPLTAFPDQKREMLFVQNAAGVLEERRVETGVDDGEYIEILSGLEEGEIVITSDASGLSKGRNVEVILQERGAGDGNP